MFFGSFDQQLEKIGRLYDEYASFLCSLAAENAKMLFVERLTFDTEFYSVLKCFHKRKFSFLSSNSQVIKAKEADLLKPSKFIGFILENSDTSENQLFEEWTSKSFSKGKLQTDSQKDYMLYELEDGLISGYQTFLDGEQKGLRALYNLKDSKDLFIMYQKNTIETRLEIYEKSRIDEALQLFQNTRLSDKQNGFSVEEI